MNKKFITLAQYMHQIKVKSLRRKQSNNQFLLKPSSDS